MSAAPVLTPRKLPRQVRSQITVTALLDATKLVLLKRGFRDCTTNHVAEVAGVGIGSLYEYFPNKEALVAALVGRETERFMRLLERDDGRREGAFGPALRCWLQAALEALEAHRDLLRVLLVEYPYVAQLPEINALPRRISELAAIRLRSWGHCVQISDHPAMYFALANMLAGVVLTQTLQPSVSRDDMLDALVEILLRVLQPGSAVGPEARRMSAGAC